MVNFEHGACALHYAAIHSNKNVIDSLIRYGISVNMVDKDNQTPLLWACIKANNIENVKVLLGHGADIQISSKEYGASALHYAAQLSDKSMVEFLILNGISVNVVDNENKTPLLWACQKAKNLENANILLLHGADVKNFDKYGASALYYAAKFADTHMIEFLFQHGISVNVMDSEDTTPLLWACQKANNVENIRVLLRYKAVTNTVSKHGACALHIAATYSDRTMIEFLLKNNILVDVKDNDNKTPLLWACHKASNVGNMSVLIRHGADINAVSKEHGASALHYAAQLSDETMIEFLMRNNLFVDVVDTDNKTPLLWACQVKHNVENVSLLLRYGASLNKVCQEYGAYALHYAAKYSDKHMIEFLIGNSIFVDVMDSDNLTPLIWSCKKTLNIENVVVLLKLGADINAVDKKYGSCALHYAAKFADKSVIEFLLSKAIRINVTNYDNQTPLCWASQKENNMENMTLLLRYGANINIISNSRGACGLHYAVQLSDKSMIEFIIANGISVNVEDNDNQTPLFWACRKPNNAGNMTVLLRNNVKADIKASDKYGACAL